MLLVSHVSSQEAPNNVGPPEITLIFRLICECQIPVVAECLIPMPDASVSVSVVRDAVAAVGQAASTLRTIFFSE